MVLKINNKYFPIHEPSEVMFFESEGTKIRIAKMNGRTDVIECGTPENVISAIFDLQNMYNARDKNTNR
ncbi:MAG TPA: hypothetical protein PLU58_01670 [Saprospiraceae bacterium]|jgi:hypothetical protein|nr:hypothetical protein [Saprospiraceae bacterium]